MSALLDADAILSDHEEWMKLDEEWGQPIDLDTEEDHSPRLRAVFSTLDLKRTTFDSSFLFKKVRRKVGRQLSKRSATSYLDYKDFLNELQYDASRESSKQFYFVNGQIISAGSVEVICEKIDDYFKSIEQLAVTSTARKKKPDLLEVVTCSISSADFSFDDTVTGLSQTSGGDVNRLIDKAFDNFNSSIASIKDVDETTLESVTTLVRKFSSVLKSPVNVSPRRQRQCCEKFRDLAEFWKKRALEKSGL